MRTKIAEIVLEYESFQKMFCYVLGKSFTEEKQFSVSLKSYLVMKMQNAIDCRNLLL